MSEIRVPKFGMSTVEVDIVDIFIAVGQQVKIGDPICEVETEKVQVTLESEVEGRVTSVNVEVDQTYVVGDLVCVLE